MPLHEFDIIKKYFAPLAAKFPGSLHLTDDAALIDVPASQQLVVTKDAITQGVHFFGDEDAALIAKKLLRVNLSDLAAKGATPLAYLLAVMLPKSVDEEWIKRFAHGLAEDQAEFSISLAGGDTVSTQSEMAFSLTAFGLVPRGQMLLRSGAKVGDGVYVSSTLGDSALGLAVLKNVYDVAMEDAIYFTHRYQLPQPRVALGQKLREIASAGMDISDGLLQDLGHICVASGVGATIHRNRLPLSPAALRLLPAAWEAIISGGDDYELLFTVSPENAHKIPENCTRIGEITQGSGVILLDDNNQPLAVKTKGFQHF